MIELKDYPQMLYAAVRGTGPYRQTAGPSFDKVMHWAGPEGLIGPATKILGLSWDDPARAPEERQRYDAAITIERRMALPGGFHVGALPALTWATTIHKGSYARISESFAMLGKELGERSNLVVVGLCGMEIYLSRPETPEAELRIEICLPVVSIA